jgi:hypothetical protein
MVRFEVFYKSKQEATQQTDTTTKQAFLSNITVQVHTHIYSDVVLQGGPISKDATESFAIGIDPLYGNKSEFMRHR